MVTQEENGLRKKERKIIGAKATTETSGILGDVTSCRQRLQTPDAELKSTKAHTPHRKAPRRYNNQ
jgi:hypothetical protein